MTKIYVAGKNLERARKVMEDLRKNGHIITFDWLIDIENEKDQIKKAHDEREGVRQADVLVYLWEKDQESARYEAGMAMGLGKKIIISGTHESFFFKLSEIICSLSDNEIIEVLQTA